MKLIFTEHNGDKLIKVHHIHIPELFTRNYKVGESAYSQIRSYEGFGSYWRKKYFKGRAWEKQLYRENRYFHGRNESEFKVDVECLPDYYNGVPNIEHTSLWEFYKYIVWDRKKKRFIKDGR